MIKTNRLEFILLEQIHVEAFAKGKPELANILGVKIPEHWPHFPEIFSIEIDPHIGEWGGYFLIHVQEGILVGDGGFKGAPDEFGRVEIGYEIATEFWNRGYATEAALGMLNFAFAHPTVKAVMAHTLGETNASNHVLQKIGMQFVTELEDPEEGKIWQWQINREAYQGGEPE